MTPLPRVRTPLGAEELRQALQNCENEPINIPGAIQPHGVMLVLHPESLNILQASTNTDVIIGKAAEALIGQSIESVIGKAHLDLLRNSPHNNNTAGIRSGFMQIGDKVFDAVVHRNEGGLILELEPATYHDSPFNGDSAGISAFFSMLRGSSLALQQTLTLDRLRQMAVDQIRELTGFDRVMLYQFADDWTGTVVAESRVAGVASYLDLRFPESDIPPQARMLYTRNPLRLIADTRSEPALLYPGRNPLSGGPLDMGHSTLRSVSPVHLEYLENMQVRASMSISILQNRRLWGLIACHHRTARHVPYRVRVAAELIGNLFSAQQFSLEESKRRERLRLRDTLLGQIGHLSLPGQRFEDVVDGNFLDIAKRALDAHGIVIVMGGRFYKSGHTPSDAELGAIVAHLGTKNRLSVFQTADLCKVIPDLTHGGGVLSAPLSSVNQDFILWFRDPVQRLVRWAGKPDKNVTPIASGSGYRLSPRGSFESWLEIIRGDCEAWNSENIDTANRLLQIILEMAKRDAEAANAAKSDFLARMSHELRTPMNAILGLVTILEATQKDPHQQEYLRTLRASSNALLNVINDLLDISRIEARNFQLESQPLSLTALAQEVTDLFQMQAAEKHLRLAVETPQGDGLWCLGDAYRLKQILNNLLSNALKFTGAGSVALRLRRTRGDDDTHAFVVTVQDTGIGIAANKLNAVFERFTQADSGITRRYGGTGLGLAICKHLVTQMHGTIQVESIPGQGSTFTVTLPLPEAEPQTTGLSAPEHTPSPETGRGRILLVEDYEANILVAVTLLQGMGYAVAVARTGQEALEMLARESYDVALMDVQMPTMDGYTATRRLREQEAAQGRPRLPVIGMTAHALSGDREKCLAAGMDDYLAKPFQATDLQQKLLWHLRHAKKRQASG